MPKSKRGKKYSFTNVQKKGTQWKEALAEKVKQYAHEYERVVVFKFVNPRTDLIQDVRKRFRRSKFFLGKNKIIQIGLGRTEEEEVYPNLHKVSNRLAGQRGLLFTNESIEDILEYFNTHRIKVHSRPGCKAPSTVKLEPGLLESFTHNQEPFLRKLGMVTRLKLVGSGSGTPELLVPFQVSKKGSRLKPNEATLLRLLGYKESEFQVRLFVMWERKDNKITSFNLSEDGDMVMKKAQKTSDDDESDSEDEMTSDDDVESGDEADFMEY